MNPFEEKIYFPLARLRTQVFKPLNQLFTALGIKADMISYLGVAFMVLFIFVLPHHLRLAFWLLFGRMLADILDGPLARFQKTDSDRGKFVDVLMDDIGFALFVVGVSYAGLLRGFVAALFLFATLLVIVLMVINSNLKHKSKDWHFYASAGSFPYNFIYAAYLVFSIHVFGGNNYLNGVAEIFSVFLLVKAVSEYWKIQKSVKR